MAFVSRSGIKIYRDVEYIEYRRRSTCYLVVINNRDYYATRKFRSCVASGLIQASASKIVGFLNEQSLFELTMFRQSYIEPLKMSIIKRDSEKFDRSPQNLATCYITRNIISFRRMMER